jgi:hypothetical protein
MGLTSSPQLGASPLVVGDLVLDRPRRQGREGLSVLPTLVRIGVSTTRGLVALLFLRLIFGSRHSLGLRADDLLSRERQLVLHLIDALDERGELRCLIGHLPAELVRLASPAAIMSLVRQ